MSVISHSRTDISSIPALTRASTDINSNRSNLPTPGGELPDFGHQPTLKGDDLPVDATRVRRPSADADALARSCPASGASSLLRGQTVPQESDSSYFPSPATSISQTPKRNRSAKELIKRYESMSVSSQSTSSRSPCSSVRPDSPLPDPPISRPLSALKGKGRSPLRDSLMNLMTLFGKKGKNKDNDSTTIGSPYEASIASTLPIVISNSPSLVQRPLTTDHQPSRSGPILYLSSPDASSVLPVWMSCKATLLEDRLLLEWHTAFGNPASKMIVLERSADVHSLATTQVDPTEKVLLPNMGQDSHIFEITYARGPPEKFALSSVADRSAWVSSIWDALLQLGREIRSEDSPAREQMYSSELSGLQNLQELKCEKPDQDSSHEISKLNLSPVEEAASARSGSQKSHTGNGRMSRLNGAATLAGLVASSDSGLLLSVPSTPTKASRLSSESSSLKRCSSSDQNLDNLSLAQTQLSRLSDKRNSSLEPKVLSRHSTLDSHYSSPSRAPSILATPKSLPRIPIRQGTRPEFESRAPDIQTEDSIFDFYAQKTYEDRKLPPVPDSPGVLSEARCITRDENDATDLTQLSRDNEDVHVENDTVLRQSQTVGENIHPLITLIQDHAVQQYTQTSDLSHQIASLRNDVLTISANLRNVLSEQRPGSDLQGILEDLCMKMENSATVETQDILHQLDKKVDYIQSDIVQLMDGVKQQSAPITLRNIGSSEKDKDSVALLQELNEKIDQIHLDMVMGSKAPDGDSCPPATDSQINAKLDELISLVKTVQEKSAEQNSSEDNAREPCPETTESKVADGGSRNGDAVAIIEPKLLEVLDILKEDRDQKTAGTDQQAENARYLQELNTWLETFVNNGTSQIQKVATGVELLCKEMSPAANEQAPKDSTEPAGGLRSDVIKLMATVNATSDKTAALENLLSEAIETIKSSRDAQKAPDMETVVGLIDRQRQEQEATLRNIAAELSNDIRGERLRFVEAMKEATAINVQVHVEEFKKELSREVMTMTCEVGRLQRERQILEQQIADLFAFFAKQRAEMEQAARQQTLPPPQGPPSRSATLTRPLPAPR